MANADLQKSLVANLMKRAGWSNPPADLPYAEIAEFSKSFIEQIESAVEEHENEARAKEQQLLDQTEAA